jgi:phospholipid-translocating ATPase
MSIICETPEGEIYQYIKGADSTIELLLNEESKKSYELQKTKEYLTAYSNHGLRTLMLAYKRLSKEEYSLWNNTYEKTKKNPNHKEEDILKLYDEIEKNFNILGSTAIEDQLQDNVNEVIDSFVSIGIKLAASMKKVHKACKL